MQALYYKTWSIQAGSGSSKQVWHGQNTRIVLRQAWVGDRRTVSKGLDRRGKSREHGQESNTERQSRNTWETLCK